MCHLGNREIPTPGEERLQEEREGLLLADDPLCQIEHGEDPAGREGDGLFHQPPDLLEGARSKLLRATEAPASQAGQKVGLRLITPFLLKPGGNNILGQWTKADLAAAGSECGKKRRDLRSDEDEYRSSWGFL
jgi:hypothetical protein